MIVRDLIKEGYCIAVMQSYSYLTRGKLLCQVDWELVALQRDYRKLKKKGFRLLSSKQPGMRGHQNPAGIITRVMNREEVNQFLRLKDEHFEVNEIEPHGKIYELINKPLNELYNNK